MKKTVKGGIFIPTETLLEMCEILDKIRDYNVFRRKSQMEENGWEK